MSIHYNIFIAVLCLLLCREVATGQEMLSTADSIRMARHVPALAYAVVNDKKILETGAVGFARFRDHSRLVNVNSRFHLGSNTTNLTGFIAARLVYLKKLRWNSKLLELFPAWKKSIRPEYQALTLADILSQQGNIPTLNSSAENANIPPFDKNLALRRQKFAVWLLQQKPLPHGTVKHAVYTAGGTAIAAVMLEKASGKSWESLVETYINQPLHIAVKSGMPNRINIDEPWGHWMENGVYTSLPPDHWLKIDPALVPALDANMSVHDYAIFALENLKGLAGKSALMPQQVYQTLHFVFPDYGLGWGNVESGDNHISQHDGAFETFFCHIELWKEKKIGVVVMCNSSDQAARGAVINLSKQLREHYFTK